MARSDIPTLLSLDSYARIMGWDPVHFNQVTSEFRPELQGTSRVWYQYSWQLPGRASRYELSTAIAEAEQMIAQEVGFWPAPKFLADEVHRFPLTRVMPSVYLQNRRQTIQPTWQRYLQPGRRVVDSVQAGVNIAASYSDPDSDGFDERVSFTVVHADAASWTPRDIAVFPPGTTDTSEVNRIKDLDITISGTTITITGESVWFVDPDEWENAGVNRVSNFINGDTAVFLLTVDVYRVHASSDGDTNAPVQFAWQDRDLPTDFQIASGLLQIFRPKQGIISFVPATWSNTTSTWTVTSYNTSWGYPDLMKINYKAGWEADRRGRMAPPFDRAVAALATCRLGSPVSGGGESVFKMFAYWQEIPDKPELTFIRAQCPFGPQRGAWIAWQVVQRFLADTGGFAL